MKDSLSNPLVSVVTPVFNGEKCLKETILSILGQTYTNLELILVNDGSTDKSKEVIEEFLSDSRVRYFEKDNSGIAPTRNYAIKRARGELIAFCDQDDIWMTDKLQCQIPLFRESDIGLVYAGAQEERFGENNDIFPTFRGDCFEELLKNNFIYCCTVVVRKKFLEGIGLFDEDVDMQGADDRYVWLRLSEKYQIDAVDKILARHVVNKSSYSMQNQKMLGADIACLGKIFENCKPRMGKRGLYALLFNVYRQWFWMNINAYEKIKDAARCGFRAWLCRKYRIDLLIFSILLLLLPEKIFFDMKKIKKQVVKNA